MKSGKMMSRKWVRWTVIILGSLVAVVGLALVVLYSLGTARLNQTYAIPVTVPAIPSDAAAIQGGSISQPPSASVRTATAITWAASLNLPSRVY